MFCCCLCIVGVGVAVRQWINASWWPFARFTMRTQTVLIVMKYKQARFLLGLSVAHTLIFYLLIQFSVVARNLLYILRILSFQCVCVRYHSFGRSLCWLSQTIRLKISSLSFVLFFASQFFFLVRLVFYAYNLLNFFSLQRLNFINSNKTDKIKINGIWWRNRRAKWKGT